MGMKQIMELIKGKGNPAPSTSINSHQFTLFCELIGELIGLLTALAPPPKRNLFLFVCCARPCSSAAMKTFFNCWRMALRGRKEINLFFFLNGALNPIKKERLTFLPLFSSSSFLHSLIDLFSLSLLAENAAGGHNQLSSIKSINNEMFD